ncbi:hypothetical protein PSHT_13931 [Puccinia striiformis]|uniref:Uncharacterized protein n=1 Tax=Puccinia striiformis TaxID=27350 RepID=A0A2S4UMS5_9BASI|nr:hypothetical protein PSHT_13931 [Puccinia striiformis]
MKRQQLTHDNVSTQSNPSLMSSGSSNHCQSSNRSSVSSDLVGVTLQTETFNLIQNVDKGLQEHGNNAKELTQIAQPLFQIPKEEPFISTTVQQLLLQPNLNQYSRGDSKTKKGPIVKTPYTLVKEALDAKDTQWLAQNLSIQLRDNLNDVERVDKIIGAKLKADKNTLAAIIKENLDSPDALTSQFKDAQGKKIANDQHITKPAKARLAYLRFQIHLNNLLIIKNKGTKITTPGFWNQIDKDLAHRLCGTKAYQFTFNDLVLLKDGKV